METGSVERSSAGADIDVDAERGVSQQEEKETTAEDSCTLVRDASPADVTGEEGAQQSID
jgi:hypothetical protein